MNNPFAQFANDWDKPSTGGYIPVPDGKHIGVIKSMLVDQNDKGSSIKTVIYFPKFNKEETSYTAITPNALPYIKRLFAATGLDKYGPEDVQFHLSESEGKSVNVDKRTNGRFRNYYFSAMKDGDEVKDEEVPF